MQQDSAQNAQAAQQRQDGQQGQYSRRTLLRRFTVAAAAGLLGLAATGGQECRAAASQDLGVLNALKTRRSVRKYTAAPVEEDLVREILRCGMQAPSACNEQPWQFVVLRNKALLAKVGGINPYAKFAKDAPVAILVCGDMRLDKCQGYWVQDCSNCAMNMLLAAHALGLGAVWTGIYPLGERVEGFRALCGLPAEVTPLALLVMGHSAAPALPENRFKEARIHQDRW